MLKYLKSSYEVIPHRYSHEDPTKWVLFEKEFLSEIVTDERKSSRAGQKQGVNDSRLWLILNTDARAKRIWPVSPWHSLR